MIRRASSAYSDQMLRDAAARTLAEVAPHVALTQGEDLSADPVGYHWGLAAEMGWTGIIIPEDHGGAGLGLGEAADIVEEMGAHLFCGPYIASAILLPTLAPQLGAAAERLLQGVAEGTVRVGLATTEASVPLHGTRALPLVEYAKGATHFLELVREESRTTFVLSSAERATVEYRQAMDETAPIGAVALPADSEIARVSYSAEDAERILLPVHVLTAVELVGIAHAALDRAVIHVRNRKQFGEPIGRFQAIKHRLADGYTMLMHARLAVIEAIAHPDELDAAQIARVIAADAALKVTSDCIQFYGGMGFSWETDAHLYLKRARRLHGSFGGTSALRRRAGDRFIESLTAGDTSFERANLGREEVV